MEHLKTYSKEISFNHVRFYKVSYLPAIGKFLLALYIYFQILYICIISHLKNIYLIKVFILIPTHLVDNNIKQ
jgi:hypothetical protein